MLAIVFNDGSIIIAKLYNIPVINTFQYHNIPITNSITNPNTNTTATHILRLILSFPKLCKVPVTNTSYIQYSGYRLYVK